MDLTVEEFIDGVLSKEAIEKPCDDVKLDDLEMRLPQWFDEELFNKGRRLYSDFRASLGLTMMMGLVAVLAIPSILRVLIATHRSSTVYTAYKRYVSTLLHVNTWFEYELKPGTKSWKSLHTVRSRHLRAAMAGKLKGYGIVSQRDLALTQFGFVGFSMLKPDKFGIRQLRSGDWEAYNHLWRVVGHMIGIEDRYNICRKTVHETREVCRILQVRVFTPCMENVPEHHEYMSRVLLEGYSTVIPRLNPEAAIYFCKYLCDVPGYIYTEEDRIALQEKLFKQLNGKSPETGVDASKLMSKPAIEGLPNRTDNLLYLHDFDSLDTAPAYKRLTSVAKSKLNVDSIYLYLLCVDMFRAFANWMHMINMFTVKYFPFGAMRVFGIRNAFVDMFADSPTQDAKLKLNSEYYLEDDHKLDSIPWYKSWLSLDFKDFFGKSPVYKN